MELARRYRDRLRGRPDSEHGQALLRAVIVCLLLTETAWMSRRDPGRAAALWGINAFSIGFSLALLACILWRPGASPWRRVVGAVHDNVAITAWLFLSGPGGALAMFVYPFVTVGNGFRYGVRYLAWSGLLGAAGIAALVFVSPAWQAFGLVGVGVLLSHVVVTVYTGALLQRLHEARCALERMATCDVLTGLPNRRFFMERLSSIVAARHDRSLACLYLDLDGFKAVNDRCGHRVGDALLNTVGRQVLGCLPASDMLARIGGDEFSVVLDGPDSRDEAVRVADCIIRAIESISAVDGHPVVVSVSVGIAFVPAEDRMRWADADELLRAADEAMYAAKRSGSGQYRFVDLRAPLAA